MPKCWLSACSSAVDADRGRGGRSRGDHAAARHIDGSTRENRSYPRRRHAVSWRARPCHSGASSGPRWHGGQFTPRRGHLPGTVAGSLMANPAGSTFRAEVLAQWSGGRHERHPGLHGNWPGAARRTRRPGADRRSAQVGPRRSPTAGPWRPPRAAGARDAGPDAAVPVPATVVPQAASPIMSPAAMPPSAARLAAPSGLPSVLVATPFRTGGSQPAPRCSRLPRPPAGQNARGKAWPPDLPRGSGQAGPGAPAPAGSGVGLRTTLGFPKPTRTHLDGPRHRLVPSGRIRIAASQPGSGPVATGRAGSATQVGPRASPEQRR